MLRIVLKNEQVISKQESPFGAEACADICPRTFICSLKLTVFLELRSRKTVRLSEQIMSADNYSLIIYFRAIVIILQVIFTTRAVLEIGEYHSDMPQI